MILDTSASVYSWKQFIVAVAGGRNVIAGPPPVALRTVLVVCSIRHQQLLIMYEIHCNEKARPPIRLLHTHRQDRLQYTAPQLASAQCNYIAITTYAHTAGLFTTMLTVT